MIIIPDLFSPYVEGVETARKANWDDLKNYNSVQEGQIDNLFDLATFSPKVNRQFEETDKLALENLFGEENFQNKLLGEILNNRIREAQAANLWRQAQGISLGRSGGATAGQPAAPGGTAANNPAGSGLPTATGKTAKTAQTPPGTPAAATVDPQLAARQNYAAQYGLPLPNNPVDSYLLDESRGKVARNPFTPVTINRSALDNIPALTAGSTPLAATERMALEANGVTLPDPSVFANMQSPFNGYYDTSAWTPEQWSNFNNLQDNQGMWINQDTFVTKRGNYVDAFPVNREGYVTHRYVGRNPTIQVQ